jgi:hypothetical protein
LLFRNEKVSKKGVLRAEKSRNRPFLDPPKLLITPIQIGEKKQKTKSWPENKRKTQKDQPMANRDFFIRIVVRAGSGVLRVKGIKTGEN